MNFMLRKAGYFVVSILRYLLFGLDREDMLGEHTLVNSEYEQMNQRVKKYCVYIRFIIAVLFCVLAAYCFLTGEIIKGCAAVIAAMYLGIPVLVLYAVWKK